MINNELQYLHARIRKKAVLKLADPLVSPQFRISNRLEATKIHLSDSGRILLNEFVSEILPGDIVFDIGANIGQYSLPAAIRTGPSGQVHAFEPAPIWARRLQENIELNNLSNVIIHPLGLSDHSGQRTFTFKNTQGSGMGSVVENYHSYVEKKKLDKIQIEIENGDLYLARHNISLPHVAKIDVEGAELEVLRGLEQAFKNDQCRFILCEVHPDYIQEPMAHVENIIRGFGFDLEIKESLGPPHLFHILARKP
jgi:FkbM family methyltransferase